METLKDKDMIYYFNAKGGLKTLVESLYLGDSEAMQILAYLLADDEKLREDFQR